MKKTKIRSLKQLEKFGVADYKDVAEIFYTLDGQLREFGLELELGDNSDDNYIWRIIKRKKI